MAKFLKTGTKRMLVMAGMLVTGLHAITMYYPNIPSIPFLGEGMALAAAGGVTVFGAWLMFDNQLNG